MADVAVNILHRHRISRMQKKTPDDFALHDNYNRRLLLTIPPIELGTISLKLLGGKLAPNLVYLVLRKELLKSESNGTLVFNG